MDTSSKQAVYTLHIIIIPLWPAHIFMILFTIENHFAECYISCSFDIPLYITSMHRPDPYLSFLIDFEQRGIYEKNP